MRRWLCGGVRLFGRSCGKTPVWPRFVLSRRVFRSRSSSGGFRSRHANLTAVRMQVSGTVGVPSARPCRIPRTDAVDWASFRHREFIHGAQKNSMLSEHEHKGRASRTWLGPSRASYGNLRQHAHSALLGGTSTFGMAPPSSHASLVPTFTIASSRPPSSNNGLS